MEKGIDARKVTFRSPAYFARYYSTETEQAWRPWLGGAQRPGSRAEHFFSAELAHTMSISPLEDRIPAFLYV